MPQDIETIYAANGRQRITITRLDGGTYTFRWAEYSEEPYFWRGPETYDPLIVYQPTTWLLKEGWRRGGPPIRQFSGRHGTVAGWRGVREPLVAMGRRELGDGDQRRMHPLLRPDPLCSGNPSSVVVVSAAVRYTSDVLASRTPCPV